MSGHIDTTQSQARGRGEALTQSVPMVNQRLAALPRNERDSMLEQCETVELSIGQVLAEPGQAISHVYFPAGAIISLLATVEDDTTLEVGLVGADGMLDTSLALGIETSSLRAVVRAGGTALRMEASTFRRCLSHSDALRQDLNRYVCVLLAQLAQTAVCTRFHLVEARLARWLLMIHDRAGSDHLELTHGLLAEMLGVRRSGITTAAGLLRQANIIRYTRGDITVVDRPALEQASCPCYRMIQESTQRLLPPAEPR